MRDMPVFVKIDEYKDIVDIINLTHDKIKRARQLLTRIDELKEQEDLTIRHWKDELNQVEQRVVDVDRKLFEPKI